MTVAPFSLSLTTLLGPARAYLDLFGDRVFNFEWVCKPGFRFVVLGLFLSFKSFTSRLTEQIDAKGLEIIALIHSWPQEPHRIKSVIHCADTDSMIGKGMLVMVGIVEHVQYF